MMHIDHTMHEARIFLSAALFCVIAFPVNADVVSFSGGGRLTGEVLSIEDCGTIRMTSPMAKDVIHLAGPSVDKVDFIESSLPEVSGKTRFDLPGGDFIMGQLLSLSSDGGAVVIADGLGKMTLPPGCLRSIEFGIEPVDTIYSGPDALAKWVTDGAGRAQNWEFERDRLIAKGTGKIGRMLELPDRYLIKVNLSWQGNPNIRIGFSDPLAGPQERVDRYYLQFNRAGLEMKREAKNGRAFHSVGVLNRTPEQFPNRKIEIEIRVDRQESMIRLLIDGKPEGNFMDPLGNAPVAGGISFENNAGAADQVTVHHILASAWDQSTARSTPKQTEAVYDVDTLFLRDGDRFGGVLESITPSGNDLRFRMRVEFRDQPIEVLGEDVASVHFAADSARVEPAAGPFVIQLHDRGRFRVTQSLFDAGEIQVKHPVFGDLKIPRSAVSSLEKNLSKEAPGS